MLIHPTRDQLRALKLDGMAWAGHGLGFRFNIWDEGVMDVDGSGPLLVRGAWAGN